MPTPAGVDLNASDFRLGSGGDDVPAMNRLVAEINAAGDPQRCAYKGVRVQFPSGTYDIRSGGIDPILVSNVVLEAPKTAVLEMRDGPFMTLGSSLQLVENFVIEGFTPKVAVGDTATDCALVKGINCARVFIEHPQPFKLPHLFKGVAAPGGILSTIFIRDVYGLGDPSFNWVDIDTQEAKAAAGLYLINVNGYPHAPPANPAIVPSAISDATRTDPVSIATSPTKHGLATGDKVRIGDVRGMTELNGNDYTITAVDPGPFTLDGVNGRDYGEYTSGGKVAALHWAEAYDTAVLSINGKWDTAILQGCVLQHWAWLWKLRSTSMISFILDQNVIWDYGGEGRFDFTFSGGSVSHVEVEGGWTFTMNGDFIRRTIDGSGAVLNMRVNNHKVGLLGGDFFNEDSGRHLEVVLNNVEVRAIGRTKHGPSYLARFGHRNNRLGIDGVWSLDPDRTCGRGARRFLSEDVGIEVAAEVSHAQVTNCDMDAVSINYDIPLSAEGMTRTIAGNTCRDGLRPEYMSVTSPTVSAPTWTWQNTCGMPANVVICGRVSSVELSYVGADRQEVFKATGQTSGVFTVGNGQWIRIRIEGPLRDPIVHVMPVS